MLIFKAWKIKNKIKIIHNSISHGRDANENIVAIWIMSLSYKLSYCFERQGCIVIRS